MDALKDIQDTSAKTVTLTLSIYQKHIDIVTNIVSEKNEIKNYERSCLFFLSTVACSYGLFGQDCTGKCNDTCKGCNNVNGLCDRECHPGWRGEYCEKGWLTHWACVFVLVDMIQLYR